ncbi:mediator of RNA polymerase II transcription subunit 22 isoform X2 [Chiloscyllium plagiosum]|uniref:mediator of RNA polymerase II transcription subunit 22 isoform X2 n=1 Tax=Chiloscyllium plagiosum TaxID=36176 RepID=UPI001CB7D7FC|nr:mediator of RNA polymerase II transcription subunit 22 isoform X2 [Chiloscyllium plagiosum]
MSQQRTLPQSKELLLQSYNKRLKDDIKSILDNFTEIVKSARVEDETQVSRATQCEQDHYEMHVRAANIIASVIFSSGFCFTGLSYRQVRAGESLMKLVSDLKQFLILNDFPSVNEAINQRKQQLRNLQEECDKKLITLRDEIAVDLYELEEEYYSSSYSLWDGADLPLCEAYRRGEEEEEEEEEEEGVVTPEEEMVTEMAGSASTVAGESNGRVALSNATTQPQNLSDEVICDM